MKLALFALPLLISGSAFAAEAPATPAQPAAHGYPSECNTEVSRYCTMSLDDADRFDCLRAHMDQLNRLCKAAMRKASAGRPRTSSGANMGD